MRKFKIVIGTEVTGGDFGNELKVDDDITPDGTQDEAKDIFFDYCSCSYHGIKNGEGEQDD